MPALLDTTLAFIERNWISLSIITAFSYIAVFIIRWYGSLSHREASILFAQGICVIVLMYFLQWSINASGTGASKDLNLFLFQVEVSGKNFLNTFQEAWDTQSQNLQWSAIGSKLLPAFLEELFKFLMLIFFLKNTTRKILAALIILLGFNALVSQAGNGNMLSSLLFIGACLGFCWFFFSHEKQGLKSINHGIYGVGIIAAGFAFGENIKYLIDHEQIIARNPFISGGSEKLIYLSQLSFLRSIFGNTSHILFSAIVGYFFARGFFGAFDIIDSHTTQKHTTWLRLLGTKKFMQWYKIKMALFGLLIATVVHTIYNFFMSGEQFYGFGGMGGVIVTLIVGVGAFEMYVLRERKNVTDYSSITEKLERGQKMREIRNH